MPLFDAVVAGSRHQESFKLNRFTFLARRSVELESGERTEEEREESLGVVCSVAPPSPRPAPLPGRATGDSCRLRGLSPLSLRIADSVAQPVVWDSERPADRSRVVATRQSRLNSS
jgi:hypothetical protein